MTEAPAGTWLCPSCSPSAAFYIEQLVTKRAASPVVPKEAAGSATGKQKKQKPVSAMKERVVAKKGVAVKKSGAQKPKPKWKGWMELSSDHEQEFKKNVNAQWDVEADVVGRRRRGSRAVVQESELNSRALRARFRSEQEMNKAAHDEDEDEDEGEEAESDEYIYQDEEDTSVHTSAESEESEKSQVSVIYIPSDDSNDSENTMDIDDSSQSAPSEFAPGTSPPGTSEVSPILEASLSAIGHENDQELLLATDPIVNNANLRDRRQGICWGGFPESAMRSTLPRLE